MSYIEHPPAQRSYQTLQVIFEASGQVRAAELPEGISFYLADALACHAQALAHVGQRVLLTTTQAKAHLKDKPLAGRQH
jgi:hypothetical protein